MKDGSSKAGFSIVEVLLSVALFAMLVTVLVGAYLYGEESTALAGNRARAAMLAEGGLEATRNIRDAGFANLSDGTYGLTTTGNQWNLSGSQDVTDIFTRQIVISAVDSKRKLVTSNVTWQQNPERTGVVSLSTRLTNWIAYGIGNWASTTQPASIDFAGANDGNKIEVVGNYAYAVRNGAGAPNFVIISVGVPASPVIVGSLTLSGTPQNIFVLGNYAYVANNNVSGELQIIDVSNPAAPSLVATYDAPGSANILGLYAVGTTLYAVRTSSVNDEFMILNVATPATPTLVGSLDLGNTGNEVVVSGSYAYVATADNAKELMVINISTPTAPVLAGSLNLAGNTDATTLAIAGSTLYIAQTVTLSTVNIATPTAPALLGSIIVVGNINDIALNLGNANTYVFLATQDSLAEFKVINVTNPASPALLGVSNITGLNPLFGVAYSQALDRAFAVGQSDTQEFIVIAPS